MPTPGKPSEQAQRTIALLRLAASSLDVPRFASAAEVVRTLGAVQSQDYNNAKWAIAQRTRGLRDSDIERAVAGGAILRTHVLRPTWHFVLPQDIRWMLDLTAPRIRAAMAYYDRTLGLDAKVMRRGRAALERALRDGAQLTRSELTTVLRRARIPVPTGQHVGHLLMRAELDAVIISGARRGKQFTYALFDDRVPQAQARERDESLRDLSRRYFTTRGPATLHDFAWWSGLTVADAKRGVEANGRSLKREEFGGRIHWSAAERGSPRRGARVAHLLPNYDEYFVGHKDRSAIAQRLQQLSISPRVDALMGHILFIDGQIVGGWQRRLGKAADVELRLLVPLAPAERALVQQAVKRFGEFLQLPVRITR